MKISSRLREAMASQSMGFQELQRKSKIPKSTLADLLNDKYEWKTEQLRTVSRVLDTNIHWLLTGAGMRSDKILNKYMGDLDKIKTRSVPVVGYADCGRPAASWYEHSARFIQLGDVSQYTAPFILIAKGDSMSPYILNGDKLLCADVPFSQIKDRTAVVASYKASPGSAEANAKLIIKKKDYCILYSVNTKFEPVIVHYSEIYKIYKLVRIIREVR